MVGIKGWNMMPNSCRECRCKDWLLNTNGTRRYYCMANGRAKFLGFRKELNNPRPDFCPLVEIKNNKDE